jgi:hypothetical protein
MPNVQVERGYLTQSLGSASHSGEHGLKTVPGLLKLVLEKEAWRERIIVQTGEEFPGFPNFKAYVEANSPRGLGTDVKTIEKLIDANDTKLLKAFHDALKHQGQRTDFVDNINEVKRPDGTSKAYAIQKLSDEGRIDLLDQVKAGKLSASAAMKKAGFRRPKISVRLDDPESAAKTLLTHASPEFLAELRRLLNPS